MKSSAEVLLGEDLASGPFRAGMARGAWGLPVADDVPSTLQWPTLVVWIAPAPRANAPERFYFNLDMSGYRGQPPTGTLWDPKKHAALDTSLRPKGRPNSRFAKVFRTDWKIEALYHPYDRVAADSHKEWKDSMPHLIWTPEHTILDYLVEIHCLLNGSGYVGV